MADNRFDNLDKNLIQGLDKDSKPEILKDTEENFEEKLKKVKRRNTNGRGEEQSLLDLTMKVKNYNNKKENRKSEESDSMIKSLIEDHIGQENFASESARISRYDDYRIIDKLIPEISAAIDVFTTSIIAPDDTSKLSLMYKVNTIGEEDDSENREVIAELDRIVERYNLNDILFSSIREGLLLGDLFYIVKDTTTDIEKILNENDDVLGRDSSNDKGNIINEQFVNQENKDDDLRLLITHLNENLDGKNKSNKKIKHKEEILNEQIKVLKEEIVKSINDKVEFFDNSSELLSDVGKYKGSSDLKRFLDLANDVKDKDNTSKLKTKDASVYFRHVEPEDMVKLEIDGLCIGYIYIEPDSGHDIKGGPNPLLSAVNNLMSDGYDVNSATNNMNYGYNVTSLDPAVGTSMSKDRNSGMNATSGSYIENGNTLMAYQGLVDSIIKGIAKKIDMDFINKNDSFKDIIYRLIRKNYIIEKGIKMTFLKPDEVIHHKLDSSKTYGVSRVHKSLFFAKLYLSTLVTSMMVKLNQSRDTRVFRVKTGLDDDFEGTIEEVIRNVRSNETSTDIFGDNVSVQTLFNQIGNLEYMYLPEKDGETPLEIDTISGIQIDINDDFLDWLKKSVISGSGVPLNYIDAEADTDYARSLSMQNNGFVRRVINYQNSFGTFYTEVLRRIYHIENNSSDKKDKQEMTGLIEAYFPPPVFLNLGNLNEEIGAVQQMIEFLVPLYLPETEDEDENEKFKRLFRQALIKKEFMPTLNYESFEGILDEIKTKVENGNKIEKIINTLSPEEETETDSGFGSDDSPSNDNDIGDDMEDDMGDDSSEDDNSDDENDSEDEDI